MNKRTMIGVSAAALMTAAMFGNASVSANEDNVKIGCAI